VEVVAHRGASAEAPEHTLAAYRQAISSGVDAVECDVRLTRDGVLVCVHDRRIDRTSSGRGVVSTLTLTDLEEFHFRARGTSRRMAPVDLEGDLVDEESGRVLTVNRLLEYVTSTPGQVRLAIETKHPTRYGRRVELALIEALRHFGLMAGGRPAQWSGRSAVRVMSFSPLALRRLQALAPELPTVQLVRRVPPRGGIAPPTHAAGVGVPISLLRRQPGCVTRLQSAGKEVHVYTVNDDRDIDLVLSLGVDAVITDRPVEVLTRLGRSNPDQAQPPSGHEPRKP
jgi:glycerophosphoryl diester phosphodiesterase